MYSNSGKPSTTYGSNPHNSRRTLPLPPYGKVIEAYQQERIKLKYYITIYIGINAKQDAYLDKCHGSLCMYLPYEDNVDKYYWPIYGQNIIVDHSSGLTPITAKKICFYLIKTHQPRVMWLQYHDFDNETNFYFVNEAHSHDKKEFENVR